MLTGNHHYYDSMLEFINQADQEVNTDNYFNSSRQENPDRTNFTKTKTFRQAVELALHGWPEGLSMIQDALDDIEALPAIEPLPVFDVCGEAFNLDAVLQGQPENMFYFMPQESHKPRIIQLAFNFGYNAQITSAEVMARGAAIASAVNDIENAGMRVELYAYQSTAHGLYTTTTVVKIKESQEPLELERMVFAAAHPAMHRRLNFSTKEQYSYDEFQDRFGSGYGSSREPTCSQLAEAGLQDDNLIKVDKDSFNPDQVKRCIQQQLDSILEN